MSHKKTHDTFEAVEEDVVQFAMLPRKLGIQSAECVGGLTVTLFCPLVVNCVCAAVRRFRARHFEFLGRLVSSAASDLAITRPPSESAEVQLLESAVFDMFSRGSPRVA